jgi:Tfp pilus assembly protein FimT
MSISIPAFSRWAPGYKLRGATRDLYSDFAVARMTAVNLKGECAVVFNTSTNQYRIWACGPNQVFDNASGDDVLVKTVDLSDYGKGIRYGSGEHLAYRGTFGDGITFNRTLVSTHEAQ